MALAIGRVGPTDLGVTNEPLLGDVLRGPPAIAALEDGLATTSRPIPTNLSDRILAEVLNEPRGGTGGVPVGGVGRRLDLRA